MHQPSLAGLESPKQKIIKLHPYERILQKASIRCLLIEHIYIYTYSVGNQVVSPEQDGCKTQMFKVQIQLCYHEGSKIRGARQHRGSILASHPAARGPILSILRKFILKLLKFINGAGLRKVYRSLILLIQPIQYKLASTTKRLENSPSLQNCVKKRKLINSGLNCSTRPTSQLSWSATYNL